PMRFSTKPACPSRCYHISYCQISSKSSPPCDVVDFFFFFWLMFFDPTTPAHCRPFGGAYLLCPSLNVAEPGFEPPRPVFQLATTGTSGNVQYAHPVPRCDRRPVERESPPRAQQEAHSLHPSLWRVLRRCGGSILCIVVFGIHIIDPILEK
ncbi:hypothetical protein EDB85DRAFT_1953256, partial [Lactarius pseudohatsudake]